MKILSIGQLWWHMPISLALKRLKHKDYCKFKISLGYILRLCHKKTQKTKIKNKN